MARFPRFVGRMRLKGERGPGGDISFIAYLL